MPSLPLLECEECGDALRSDEETETGICDFCYNEVLVEDGDEAAA